MIRRILAATITIATISFGLATIQAQADTTSYPDRIVNGDFSYRGNEIISKRTAFGAYLTFVDATTGAVNSAERTPADWTQLSDWDAKQFGWSSNDSSVFGYKHIVELQRSASITPGTVGNSNVWAEISAAAQGKYIYQDIATTPGAQYSWTLKHASRNTGTDDSMQVLIGIPGKEAPQEAYRRTTNGKGDKTGNVGTTITTHGTAQEDGWESYSGIYTVPAGQTVTRFTFKSVKDSNAQGESYTSEGNEIDDIQFTKAYPLHYDLKGGMGSAPQQHD